MKEKPSHKLQRETQEGNFSQPQKLVLFADLLTCDFFSFFSQVLTSIEMAVTLILISKKLMRPTT